MTAAPYMKSLQVNDYNELRDKLPSSGIFDMMDCSIEIWCPEDSDVSEVQKMVRLVESMVNVTDVQIGSRIEDMVDNLYVLKFIETSIKTIRNRFNKER